MWKRYVKNDKLNNVILNIKKKPLMFLSGLLLWFILISLALGHGAIPGKETEALFRAIIAIMIFAPITWFTYTNY